MQDVITLIVTVAAMFAALGIAATAVDAWSKSKACAKAWDIIESAIRAIA